LIVVNCHRVSLPEEDGLKYWPDLLISPVLAENVGRIQAEQLTGGWVGHTVHLSRESRKCICYTVAPHLPYCTVHAIALVAGATTRESLIAPCTGWLARLGAANIIIMMPSSSGASDLN